MLARVDQEHGKILTLEAHIGLQPQEAPSHLHVYRCGITPTKVEHQHSLRLCKIVHPYCYYSCYLRATTGTLRCCLHTVEAGARR